MWGNYPASLQELTVFFFTKHSRHVLGVFRLDQIFLETRKFSDLHLQMWKFRKQGHEIIHPLLDLSVIFGNNNIFPCFYFSSDVSSLHFPNLDESSRKPLWMRSMINRSEWRFNSIPEQKDQNWVLDQNHRHNTYSRCKQVLKKTKSLEHLMTQVLGQLMVTNVFWFWGVYLNYSEDSRISTNRHNIDVICRGRQLLEYLCICTDWSLFSQWPIPIDFPLEEDPKNPICSRMMDLKVYIHHRTTVKMLQMLYLRTTSVSVWVNDLSNLPNYILAAYPSLPNLNSSVFLSRMLWVNKLAYVTLGKTDELRFGRLGKAAELWFGRFEVYQIVIPQINK